MPRIGRIAIPNFPHHLVQRGHNQRDVFFTDGDRLGYLDTLVEMRAELCIKLYGYCLMTNHVHLIVDPGDHAENLGRLMKRLAGRHTRRINRINLRSGTLWGGRYKCSPIETDRYLLACMRYVDLNPVRAGIVAAPDRFRWSSYRAKVGISHCDWLDDDPCTLAFAVDLQRRRERYQEFVAEGDDELELRFIRASLQRGHVTASDEFAAALEQRLGKSLPQRERGPPFDAKKKTGAEAPVIVDK
jgi:putative transposase